jgi:hypothetical protein
MCTIQVAQATGNGSGAVTSGTPAGTPGDCVADGSGGTNCSMGVTPSGGTGSNCGTFNGDQVCVASIPPGTCQSFASGGVACTMATGSTTPPPGAPTASGGAPATPTAQVTNNTNTTNYYSSSVVSSSAGPVVSIAGGVNSGNAGTGSGTSSGSGSGTGNAPNAANGDCGASGVDCSDGTPSLASEPTIATSTGTYTAALSSVPIVAAVAGISGSVPSGSCPTATFSVYGSTYTLDEQCTLWSSVASVVQLVMLACWALIGVKILMSA